MKKRCLLAAVLLVPMLSWGYGPMGHAAVAELAQRQLSESVREEIAKINGSGASLASVASKADELDHGTRPDTKGWHFADMPLEDQRYDPAKHCVYHGPDKKPPVPDTCAISAIAKNARLLGDRSASRPARAEALMFLVHLVGDVHQPMHTLSDAGGGNQIHVHFPCENKAKCTGKPNTSLHAVWDDGMFRAPTFYSFGDLVDYLEDHYYRGGKAPIELTAGCPRAGGPGLAACWLEEAHAIARKPGYMQKDGDAIGSVYVKMVAEDRDTQIVRAGLRLADLLESTLRPDAGSVSARALAPVP